MSKFSDTVPPVSIWSKGDRMSSTKLVSRDEQEMVTARKNFYKKTKKREKILLKRGDWIGKRGIPIFVTFFCIFYWGYGLSHYLLLDA